MIATFSKQKAPALQTGAFQNLCFSRARNPIRTTKCLYSRKPELATPHNFNQCRSMVELQFTNRTCQRVPGSRSIELQGGVIMAKHKKKFKPILHPDERFTQISRGYMKGAAWLDLSDCARVLLIYMRTLYNKNNNGQINMSARYGAKALKRSPSTIQRALIDLTAKGFIVPHKPGSIGIDGSGIATAWELTDFGIDGKPPKYLYKTYRSKPKNKSPYSNRVHPNCKSSTLKLDSVLKSSTGVLKSSTGKGDLAPDSVLDSSTYIDHIPLPTQSFPNSHLENPSITDGLSQSKLADKFGSDGWEVLMELSHETLRTLTDKNNAGLLTNSEIETARLEASQTSQRLAS